ncbi:hypothetical protein [Luteimonas deserti]|uniref:Uncharacterized protein n=1 Tax=Luteimonas deserti TaxID=2752306 RepID=A0A7Z0TVA8_9GAMM|nr:hypothetical protein [Luteimonas deserti]NYZ62059.1 hypothetical protein [Luteimonas deserti]
MLEAVLPQPDDLHALKPRHSAFHRTPLESILARERVGRGLPTGVSTEAASS